MIADRLAAIPREEGRVILATGKYVGEGFDDPRLDSLFLTLPVSWRGTIAQCACRMAGAAREGSISSPEQGLSLRPSLKLLERRIDGLHVGGKSALDWHGVRQYAPQQEMLHLYGWTAARLPEWFVNEFSAEYHRKRLFDETPGALLYVLPQGGESEAPLVSAPERALLELLSEVGVRQPLSEARELTEGTYTLRGAVLRELLMRCASVKTVRLCLRFGRELSLPWMDKLVAAELPTGSDRPWVSRSGDGILVLKP